LPILGTSASQNTKSFLSVPVQYVVVAGGGGGGLNGGGGGGGGYRSSVSGETSGAGTSIESAFEASIGVSYTVTVGGGGTLGGQNTSDPYIKTTGSAGSNSTFATITSNGGGRGAGYGNGYGSQSYAGEGGGSGGGGWGAGGAGGAGTSGQGENGQDGAFSTPSGTTYGYGGGGNYTSITGSSLGLAGGGGGFRKKEPYDDFYNNPHSGQGAGITSPVGNQGNGQTNTGGGGAGRNGNGNGGSGVVILKTLVAAASTTGSPIVTTNAGYNIYKFNASGSITF
jgi:hypothetical protein